MESIKLNALKSIVSNTLASRALVYGYSNARIKAMQAELLSKKDFDSLIDLNSLKEIISFLDRTGYKKDLVDTVLDSSGANQVELALGKNLARTLKKLVKVSPKNAEKTLKGLFERFDVLNLKTILLAKHLNEPKEKIEPFLIDLGNLSPGLIQRLLEKKTVVETINALNATVYGKTLNSLLKQYNDSGEVTIFLTALDKHFYNNLPSLVQGFFGDEKKVFELLKLETDINNSMNVLRALKAGVSREKIKSLILDGGNVSREKFELVFKAKDFESSLKVIEKILGEKGLADVYSKEKRLSLIESKLEKSLAEKSLNAFKRSNLSLGALVGFMYLKEQEVNNIRKIIRAKQFNLNKDEIKKMLVLN